MHEKHSFYSVVNKTSKIVNEITNFICVVLLTAQVISILIMVGGRYIFHNSPLFYFTSKVNSSSDIRILSPFLISNFWFGGITAPFT